MSCSVGAGKAGPPPRPLLEFGDDEHAARRLGAGGGSVWRDGPGVAGRDPKPPSSRAQASRRWCTIPTTARCSARSGSGGDQESFGGAVQEGAVAASREKGVIMRRAVSSSVE